MEPTKSFVFQGDELAWLLSGRQLSGCPPVDELARIPFDGTAVRDRLAAKGIIQRADGQEALVGVVAFLMRSLAAARAWVRLAEPEALLLRAAQLYLVLTPYALCPGAWRLTPCPTLDAACAALEGAGGEAALGRAGEAPEYDSVPEGTLRSWLEAQEWN